MAKLQPIDIVGRIEFQECLGVVGWICPCCDHGVSPDVEVCPCGSTPKRKS